jgi:hypothetical protein
MRNLILVSSIAALIAFGVSAITDTSNSTTAVAQYGCSGNVSTGQGLFSGRLRARLAERRNTRLQNRFQTQGCSGSLTNQQVQTQSCAGTVSYQSQPQVSYRVVSPIYSETVQVEQSQPGFICDGVTCRPIDSQTQVQSFTPFKTAKPTQSKPTQSKPVLFGLSSLVMPVSDTDVPKHILAQADTSPTRTASNTFREGLIKAINNSRKAGDVNFRDAIKLRVALLSPAFVEKAQELAVTQVVFSGESSVDVPLDENGVVQVEGINWEGLTKFLEAMIPLLLTLLKAFGV